MEVCRPVVSPIFVIAQNKIARIPNVKLEVPNDPESKDMFEAFHIKKSPGGQRKLTNSA